MKKIGILIIYLFITYYLIGQNLDHLMTRKYLTCQDIEYNCSFLIPDFHKRNLIDSLNYTIQYWENRCGLSNLLFQTKILTKIEQKTFNENEINKKWINWLIDYQRYNNAILRYSNYGWRYYNIYYPNGLYIDFLDSIANVIASDMKINLTEKYLVNFYLNNFKLKDLRNEEYANSILGKLYNKYIDSIAKLPELTVSLYTGLFFPKQSAKILGNHGMIGFGFGGIFYKNSIDLLLDFKFGPPKSEYEIIYGDSLISTNKYTGMYIGLEYSRSIIKKEKSEFLLTGGFGGERITAINSDEENNIEPKFLWSPCYSVGLGYRYRYNLKTYINFQIRYQYLDFDNPEGTRLTGNSFLFRIILITSSNYQRNLIHRL